MSSQSRLCLPHVPQINYSPLNTPPLPSKPSNSTFSVKGLYEPTDYNLRCGTQNPQQEQELVDPDFVAMEELTPDKVKEKNCVLVVLEEKQAEKHEA